MLYLRNQLSSVKREVGWSQLRVNIILEMGIGDEQGQISSIRGPR